MRGSAITAAGIVAGIVLGATACAAVLDPTRLDDIDRCDFDHDCPEPDDGRYELVCVVSDEVERDIVFPGICTPRAAVSCDPLDYRGSDYELLWKDAQSTLAPLTEARPLGKRGYPPGTDGCEGGLAPRAPKGYCDDADADTLPAVGLDGSNLGQDVRDQFCRSIYCNDRYVCHTETDECVLCTEGSKVTQAGCRETYIEGERSPVYQSADELAAECPGPDLDLDDPGVANFGPLFTATDLED